MFNKCVPLQCENMGVNPIYLVFPVGIASTCSFMLPTATAANAYAFSYKRFSIIDMVGNVD